MSTAIVALPPANVKSLAVRSSGRPERAITEMFYYTYGTFITFVSY
jgi:hypothetical protein